MACVEKIEEAGNVIMNQNNLSVGKTDEAEMKKNGLSVEKIDEAGNVNSFYIREIDGAINNGLEATRVSMALNSGWVVRDHIGSRDLCDKIIEAEFAMWTLGRSLTMVCKEEC